MPHVGVGDEEVVHPVEMLRITPAKPERQRYRDGGRRVSRPNLVLRWREEKCSHRALHLASSRRCYMRVACRVNCRSTGAAYHWNDAMQSELNGVRRCWRSLLVVVLLTLTAREVVDSRQSTVDFDIP